MLFQRRRSIFLVNVFYIECIPNIKFLKKLIYQTNFSPDWCGLVGWTSYRKPKGCRFDSWSGTCLGCGPGPLVGGLLEAID